MYIYIYIYIYILYILAPFDADVVQITQQSSSLLANLHTPCEQLLCNHTHAKSSF